VKSLGIAEDMAHFRRQDLVNRAERERLVRAAAKNNAAQRRPRFSMSRLVAAFGPLPIGKRVGSGNASVPPRSA